MNLTTESLELTTDQIDLATLTTYDLENENALKIEEVLFEGYLKFDSKGMRDISEEITTEDYYRKTITCKTLVYVVLCTNLANLVFITALTLGLYILEYKKRIEILIEIEPACYDSTGVCLIPFALTASVDHRWRLWIRRINGNYFETPLDTK